MRRPRLRRLLIWLATSVIGACRAPAAPPPLEAFAAASLGPPFTAFDSARRSAGRQSPPTAFQFVPSVQAVRMMTDLGRVPDLLATADLTLFDSLVLPRHATWYAVFGSNALVLAYGPHVTPPADYRPSDWVRVHLAPGVRIGRSDPRVDPSGYRTLLAVELAARAAGRPALRDSLLAALPLRHVRRAEADLSALLTSGELDYAWTYRNLAVAHGHRWLELPDSIDQSNVALADWYGAVSAEIPGTPRSFTVRGTPILFGVTVPTEAPHRDAALGWVAELLCGRARAAIERTGFVLLDAARVVGDVPVALRERCGTAAEGVAMRSERPDQAAERVVEPAERVVSAAEEPDRAPAGPVERADGVVESAERSEAPAERVALSAERVAVLAERGATPAERVAQAA